MRRAVPAALAAIALAGCGNARRQPPDVTHPAVPAGLRTVVLSAAGVRFDAPANWRDLGVQGAQAGGVQSATATLAVWRYPRTEPLPADRPALDQARRRLIARVKSRDPSFVLRSSHLTRLAGAQAIVLLGRQTVAGLPVDVRSAHVFKDGAEVVVDAYAMPRDFARVDSEVFRPALASLRVQAP